MKKLFVLTALFSTLSFAENLVDCQTLTERECLTYPEECKIFDTGFDGVHNYNKDSFCFEESKEAFIGCIANDLEVPENSLNSSTFMNITFFKNRETGKVIAVDELGVWLSNRELNGWKIDPKSYGEVLFHYQELIKQEGKFYTYPKSCK
jgi:hypothetical protein